MNIACPSATGKRGRPNARPTLLGNLSKHLAPACNPNRQPEDDLRGKAADNAQAARRRAGTPDNHSPSGPAFGAHDRSARSPATLAKAGRERVEGRGKAEPICGKGL